MNPQPVSTTKLETFQSQREGCILPLPSLYLLLTPLKHILIISNVAQKAMKHASYYMQKHHKNASLCMWFLTYLCFSPDVYCHISFYCLSSTLCLAFVTGVITIMNPLCICPCLCNKLCATAVIFGKLSLEANCSAVSYKNTNSIPHSVPIILVCQPRYWIREALKVSCFWVRC